MLTGSTLIVVADGGRARFFSRGAPGENLVERDDLAMTVGATRPERDRAPRAFDRTGVGRHAMEHRLTAHEAAADAFLAEVADKAGAILQDGGFAHLAICAPPGAMGVLRKVLTPATREKLVVSLSKDLGKESLAEIDVRLRDLRV